LAGFSDESVRQDDVEELGLLKLDVLGIRMQSAISHALNEIERVDTEVVDIDEIPRDDPATFELIRSTHTLGCFQIESPGQRELIGKFAPETFDDLIVDISLFRPGPVKSDMVHPFLRARQGWSEPQYAHPSLIPAVSETYGVVVFHEQVLRIVSIMTGASLAAADEVRRDLGSFDRLPQVRAWFYPAALERGYDLPTVEKVWEILRAFGSFGFCKAHAAAFAVPTSQLQHQLRRDPEPRHARVVDWTAEQVRARRARQRCARLVEHPRDPRVALELRGDRARRDDAQVLRSRYVCCRNPHDPTLVQRSRNLFAF